MLFKATIVQALWASTVAALAVEPRAPQVNSCPGYAASNVKRTDTGLSADLKLDGRACNVYGKDIQNLQLVVEYQTADRLHVLIQDAAKNVYQVPGTVFPRSQDTISFRRSNLKFQLKQKPFSFSVSRQDTGEVLFNTAGSNLIFESQYLRLRTQLPNNPHLYGLGEHTDPFMLNTTGYTRTMWNRDAYGTPAGTNLYGHHDIYVDHRGDKGTHGVFLLNSNGADIKIDKTREAGQFLEYNTLGGVFDFYFFNGPAPRDVSKQYAALAKTPALQPYWGYGFHNCRYGYRDAYEIAEVIANYSAAGIPLETMWTDIDYMELRRTFSLDPERYPVQLVRQVVDYLHKHQQHYIVMVDPAMYAGDASDNSNGAYKRGVQQGVFMKEANGSVYHGVVWPGITAFPDWFNSGVQTYWDNEFLRFFDPKTGVDIDALWIDMNEPSNFCPYPCTDPAGYAKLSGNPPAPPPVRPRSPRPIPGFGPDFQPSARNKRVAQPLLELPGAQAAPIEEREAEAVSIEKRRNGDMKGLPGRELLDPPYRIKNDFGIISNKTSNTNLIHQNGLAMYDTHDMYGSMMSSASRKAMEARRPDKRPLIITRSTFAGAGKDVGHWLGDNLSTWFHYRISIAEMMAFSSIFQVPMVGADVCGFGDNTTEYLCARWATLGAFYPFYRNHNNLDAIPQEFYRRPLWAAAAKHAIDYRYRLLDYLYTAMWQQNQTGSPSISPLFFTYPNDANTFAIDKQFFFGDSLLVSPVTDENSTSVDFYLPNEVFYDFFTHKVVQGRGKMVHRDNVGYTEIPVHIKGGSIVPLRSSSANTTSELRKKNFSVVIAPDRNGKASGQLYLDDGESLRPGATALIQLNYDSKAFNVAGTFGFDSGVVIDSITVLGKSAPQAGVMSQEYSYNTTSQALRVNVNAPLNKPFSMNI